jgi:hypothetical protein
LEGARLMWKYIWSSLLVVSNAKIHLGTVGDM